ncbi:MAG: type 2 isopentenyl-diphosphate Delta-isomerase [Balneolaceae bacterium]
MSIQKRKKDHVELCLTGDVEYDLPSGFDQVYFRHNALPEINLSDVSVEGAFLGRTFELPLMISSMTGGYSGAENINAMIARVCQARNLPFGVGSQRAMLDHKDETGSFSVVRKEAPDAFIAANIGGAQLAGGLAEDDIGILIDSIRADAVIVHLNPLQELVQPEGDRNFAGIEDGIGDLVVKSPVPVIVKETGAGISGDVARRLLAVGVSVIDVAGAGGTSWAMVENRRKTEYSDTAMFDNWGIPTLICLEEVVELRNEFRFHLIASGGVRNAGDMVKAISLGADFVAMARPVIQVLKNEGEEGLHQTIETWKKQAAMILTLLGRRSFTSCSSNDLGTVVAR